MVFFELLKAGRLLETELLSENLHGHDVEEASLDVEADKQIQQIVCDVQGLRLRPSLFASPLGRVLADAASLLFIALVLFPVELYVLS